MKSSGSLRAANPSASWFDAAEFWRRAPDLWVTTIRQARSGESVSRSLMILNTTTGAPPGRYPGFCLDRCSVRIQSLCATGFASGLAPHHGLRHWQSQCHTNQTAEPPNCICFAGHYWACHTLKPQTKSWVTLIHAESWIASDLPAPRGGNPSNVLYLPRVRSQDHECAAKNISVSPV
jgi:hypothetical protein